MKLISGAGEPVVNPPSVDKGITTLAVNINLNSYMENILTKNIKSTNNISNLFKRTFQT